MKSVILMQNVQNKGSGQLCGVSVAYVIMLMLSYPVT